MAKQTINIGSAANDGTGDPLRTAMDKINDNFDEIYSSYVATGSITVGNSTVNTVVSNTGGIRSGNTTSNVVVNTSIIRIGNSTVNTFINSSSLAVQNSIGIGTTTPAARLNVVVNTTQDAVRITQTGSGNAFVVEDSSNPDGTPFVIDAAGRVNIGSSNWYASAGITPRTQINGGTTDSSVALNAWNTGVNTGAALSFNRADSITQGDFTDVVDSGDQLGRISFTGADGAAFIEAARIESAVDGTPGADDMPGRLMFSTTADGADTPSERMRITSSGNVGIGNTAPNARLQVTGTANVSGNVIIGGNLTVTTNTFNLGSFVDGANGYTYLPNGFKLNWGWVSANSTAGNVTFTAAYTTNAYSVTATSNTTVFTYEAAVLSVNNTVAVIRTANATSTNVRWTAIGM